MQYPIELSFNLIRTIFNKFDQYEYDTKYKNIKVQFFNYLKDTKNQSCYLFFITSKIYLHLIFFNFLENLKVKKKRNPLH